MADKNKVFDPIFEEKLIQAILVENEFGEQIMEVMDADYFDVIHTKTLADILKNYYFQYETFPSAELLPAILQKEVVNPMALKRCEKYLERIQKSPLNGDMEFVKTNALEFFRKQHITKTLSDDVLPLLEGETSKLDEILPVIQSALNKGTERDVGYEYEQDEEVRFTEEEIKYCKTPWEIINNILNGGWGWKRLVTFIGSSGAGKSHQLVNVGKGALLEGKVVVHYTLELDFIEVARRYDASITGIEINDIPGNKQKVLFDLKNKLPEGARLIIKEYPMKGASIQTIKSHLSRLKLKGIVPDLIVIDYGDLLRTVDNPKEKRHGLEAIWMDMKSLAQTLKIPVITATQTNRTGYNDDLITPDQVSEDFSKIMHSDIIITMARNMAQKQMGIGKMYIAKNRQGRDGQILAYAINTAKCLIEVFELTDEIEKIFEQNAMEQIANEESSLKGKLDSYLKKKNARTE